MSQKALIRVPLQLRIVTEATSSFLCAVSADRTWKCVHLKRAIEDETGIVAREIRLHFDLPSNGAEPEPPAAASEILPSPRKPRTELALDDDRLDLLPVGNDLQLTLTRRPREQAEWLERVKEFGLQLRLAPPSIRADREVVIEAVKRNWRALEFASKKLRADPEIAFTAVKQDSEAAPFVALSLWGSPEFVRLVVQQDHKLFKLANAEVQDNKEVVMAAVRKDYRALHEISARLLRDREVAVEGVLQSQEALKFFEDDIQEMLWADKQAVYVMVSKDWRALEHVEAPELLNDLDIALVAVKQDWRALRHLGELARTDREVILTAVERDWCTIACVLSEIPVDYEVIAAMVIKSWHILAYIDEEFKADKKICLSAVKQNWQALEYVSEGLKADHDLVCLACKQYGPAVRLASQELMGDLEVMMSACSTSGACLELGSEEVRTNKDVVMAAIRQDWTSIRFATEIARTDVDVVYLALEEDAAALDFATVDILGDEKAMLKFMRLRVESYLWADMDLLVKDSFLKALLDDLKVSKDIILGIVTKNWNAMAHLPGPMRRDRAIALQAVKQDPKALLLADETILLDLEVVLAAVKLDWHIMLDLPEKDGIRELAWKDPCIAMACVEQDWTTLNVAKEIDSGYVEEHWGDEDIVLECIRQDVTAASQMSKDLWAEVSIAVAICKQDWTWLKKASKAFQKEHFGNRDVVLAAVAQSVSATKEMHKDFWSDTEVMLLACEQDWEVINKAKSEAQDILWDDLPICKSAVKQDWHAYEFVSDAQKLDHDLTLMAVKQKWQSIDKVPQEVMDKHWNDEEIVVCAVKQDGMVLRKASQAMLDNKNVVRAAASKSYKSVELASARMREDPDVIIAVISHPQAAKDMKSHGWKIMGNFADEKGRTTLNKTAAWADENVVICIVNQDALALQYATEKVQQSKRVVLEAVKKSGLALQFADPALKRDYEVVRAAVAQDGGALEFAVQLLQEDSDLVMLAEGLAEVLPDGTIQKIEATDLALPKQEVASDDE